MPFTRTWDATYETQPADSEGAKLGASRIRELKSDISERMAVEHSWAGDANDGKHYMAPTVVLKTASGTQVVPAGYYKVKLIGKGGGGGGGGGRTAPLYGCGGGGGEGEQVEGWMDVIPGQTITITIGAGGAGQSPNYLTRGNGGDTIATNGSWTITCKGGSGGYAAEQGGQGGEGGKGGSGGLLFTQGCPGHTGSSIDGTGPAIASPGGGHGGALVTVNADGGTGAGGGGGAPFNIGGNGGSGFVLMEFWRS